MTNWNNQTEYLDGGKSTSVSLMVMPDQNYDSS